MGPPAPSTPSPTSPTILTNTQSIHSPPGRSSATPSPDINAGVTVILPREDWYKYSSFAGKFSFNGCGDLTSSHWLNETGLLASPIVLTTTSAVGDGYPGIWEYTVRYHSNEDKELDLFHFPAVGETYDGYLNHQIPEGNTGGGTGMICHRFKGGTGSSSRIVKGFDKDGNEKPYTVGVPKVSVKFYAGFLNEVTGSQSLVALVRDTEVTR
ncbi:hypothetical protein CCMA1212_009994 [Trichoderma ghanense]|uniref:Jacalin-type lectin domain-containing protein n=1 Tax=Trichoderma ghanense TaxID=65468 RepID=A0ABY2GSK0_9HYPO